jgi:hypothetical protein
MFTFTLRSTSTSPEPRHLVHAVLALRPWPRHVGHVVDTKNAPRWMPTCPWPLQVTHVSNAPPFGARALAGVARRGVLELHFLLGAERRFLEREARAHAQIGAAHRAVATACPAEAASEDVAEDVAEAAEDVLDRAEAGW